jgi:hypothetical protein
MKRTMPATGGARLSLDARASGLYRLTARLIVRSGCPEGLRNAQSGVRSGPGSRLLWRKEICAAHVHTGTGSIGGAAL